MKEYQFQYTKMWDTALVVLASMITYALTEIVCIKFFNANILVIMIISFALAYLLFRLFKKKVVRNCTAKISDTFMEFDFGDNIRVINFTDLISFKAYYGKNGPILYLKNSVDNFKIFANNNFCKTDDFRIFCEDTIIQLDKYKETHKTDLVHGGSVFATKGFLYFLIVTTIIYLLGFTIESENARPYIGIGGGAYLFIMWIAYFSKRDLKSK